LELVNVKHILSAALFSFPLRDEKIPQKCVEVEKEEKFKFNSYGFNFGAPILLHNSIGRLINE
jgi:hypothetical protein